MKVALCSSDGVGFAWGRGVVAMALLLLMAGCGGGGGSDGGGGADLGLPDLDEVGSEVTDALGETLLPDSAEGDSGGDVAHEVVPDWGPYTGMVQSGVLLQSFLGIASHLPQALESNFKREFELDKLQQAGFSQFRKTFRWEHMEPENDAYWFDEYNMVINETGNHGLNVMVGFRGKPSWATSDGTHDGLDVAQWSEFLGQFALEVADRVRLYEIWNEPNLKVFYSPKPNPEKYTELLSAAHKVIHEHDDDAVVLLGGLSPFDFNPAGVWGFMDDLFAVQPDLCDHFDALAIHPYTFFQRLAPEEGSDLLGVYHPGVAGMVSEARRVLAAYGCGEKEIYLTEAGWPDLKIGLESQAAYTARGILLALSQGAMAWYHYTFWDGEITPETTIPTEERFGLYTWPNDETTQVKPVYETMSVFGNQMRAYGYAGDLGAALGWEPTSHALVLRDSANNWAVALWHEVGESELQTPLSVEVPLHPHAKGTWELRNQYYELLESGPAEQALVPVAITGEVQWLLFSCDVGE